MPTLEFPRAGLNRALPEQRRAPYTSSSALNMLGVDALMGKSGGGSRGGMVKALSTQIGSGNPIRMAALCRSLVASSARIFTDVFSGSSLSGSDWTVGNWGDATLPTVTGGYAYLATALGNETRAAILTSAASISTSATRSVSANIGVMQGISGTETVSLLLDSRTNAAGQTEGIRADLKFTAVATNHWTLKVYANGVQIGSTVTYGSGYSPSLPQWFKLTIDSSKIISVYFTDAASPDFTYNATAYTPTQTLAGFELSQTATTTVELRVNDFRLEYTLSGAAKPPLMGVFVSNGKLYYQATDGTLVETSYDANAPNLPSDRLLMAAPYLEKLYIADHGILESGTTATTTAISATVGELTHAGKNFTTAGIVAGQHRLELLGDSSITVGIYEISVVAQGGDVTKIRYTKVTANDAASAGAVVSYRIGRPAKVFDAATATLSKVQIGDIGLTDGQFPLNCSIVATYGSRIMWGADSDYPQFAYASYDGNANNYLYGSTNPGSAYAWDPARVTGSAAIGDKITFMMAHRNDYFIFGCRNSIFVQRGNPPGGRLDLVSDTVGIIDKRAAARLPDQSLVVMTTDGAYRFAPTSTAIPEPISRDVLPLELRGINTEFSASAPTAGYDVLCEYSVNDQVVYIFVTPRAIGTPSHWAFDPFVLDAKGQPVGAFWPIQVPTTMDPMALIAHTPTGGTQTVWMGCRDGYVRIFSSGAGDDDGTAFISRVQYGTFALSNGPTMDGSLDTVSIKLLPGSSSVRVYAYVANSAEDCLNADRVELTEAAIPVADGDLVTLPVYLGGTHAIVELERTTSGIWAPATVSAERRSLGMLRVG